MSKIKKGFKVIRPDDRRSAIARGLSFEQLSSVVYVRNRWVKPRKGCGPLCVFKTREFAENFAGIRNLVVVKCEYKPSTEQLVWYRRRSQRWSVAACRWYNRLVRRDARLEMLPTNTALASEVRCVE